MENIAEKTGVELLESIHQMSSFVAKQHEDNALDIDKKLI